MLKVNRRVASCWIALLALGIAAAGAWGQKRIEVKDFGAIAGDGVDDAASINAAIESGGRGDTVVLGRGTYQISSSVMGKTGVNLIGAGADQTLIRFSGDKGAKAML